MKFRLALILCVTAAGVFTNAQESSSPLDVLTLEQASSTAPANNRQLKMTQQSVLSANDQILAARAQLNPQFNVQLTGASLLTPVSVSFPEGFLGSIGPVPNPSHNVLVTTNPKFSGMALAEACQSLSRLYKARS